MEHNNIKINDNYIVYGDSSFERGYQLTKELLLQPLKPTAIYSVNNVISLGTVASLNKMNVSIPTHMCVAAFGDFKYYNVMNPLLTVVNQMAYIVGQKAAEVVIDKTGHTMEKHTGYRRG